MLQGIGRPSASTVFLNGDLDEEVFIEPPEGFDEKLEKNHALKLNKALYGLKQAPRAWNKKLVNTLKELGLKQCITDTCIFFKKDLLVAVYVDDLVITGKKNFIVDYVNLISEKYKIRDLGKLSYILELELNMKLKKIYY